MEIIWFLYPQNSEAWVFLWAGTCLLYSAHAGQDRMRALACVPGRRHVRPSPMMAVGQILCRGYQVDTAWGEVRQWLLCWDTYHLLGPQSEMSSSTFASPKYLVRPGKENVAQRPGLYWIARCQQPTAALHPTNIITSWYHIVSEHLSREAPQAVQQGLRTYQGLNLSKSHMVQIFFILEDTPSVVNFKTILSAYVQRQARAARSETRLLSIRQG